MGRASDIDDYSTIEAKLLLRAVELLLEDDYDLRELEIVGKFPNSKEVKKFNMEKGMMSWMPTTELSWWNDIEFHYQSNY